MGLRSANNSALNKGFTPVVNFLPYPISMGIWIRPTAASANRGVCGVWTDSNHHHSICQTSANNWRILTRASTTASVDIGGVSQNLWHFLLARFISATNRRLSVLQANGSPIHGQNTTSRTPTMATANYNAGWSMDGTTQRWLEGDIAEWWVTSSDVQPGGEETNNHLLRHLAYMGPFALPHVANRILFYESGRHMYALAAGSVTFGHQSMQNCDDNRNSMSSTGGGGVPTPGLNPLLSSVYQRPNLRQTSRIFV